jgi:hypothetical protein
MVRAFCRHTAEPVCLFGLLCDGGDNIVLLSAATANAFALLLPRAFPHVAPLAAPYEVRTTRSLCAIDAQVNISAPFDRRRRTLQSSIRVHMTGPQPVLHAFPLSPVSTSGRLSFVFRHLLTLKSRLSHLLRFSLLVPLASDKTSQVAILHRTYINLHRTSVQEPRLSGSTELALNLDA